MYRMKYVNTLNEDNFSRLDTKVFKLKSLKRGGYLNDVFYIISYGTHVHIKI